MTKRSFSIRESLSFGWEKTKAHRGLLFKILLILFALQVMSSIVSHVLHDELIGLLAGIAIGIAQFVVGVGFTLVSLRIAQNKHVDLNDLISPPELLWRYFAASCLVGLVAFGAVLGIILVVLALAALQGGITTHLFPAWIAVGAAVAVVALGYIALRFSMVRYAVLAGKGITESLHKSTEMTDGHKWHLLSFLLVVGLLNLGGLLLFFVGLVLTIPTSLIAYAHVYQKLQKKERS
jgi:hypothetical protein